MPAPFVLFVRGRGGETRSINVITINYAPGKEKNVIGVKRIIARRVRTYRFSNTTRDDSQIVLIFSIAIITPIGSILIFYAPKVESQSIPSCIHRHLINNQLKLHFIYASTWHTDVPIFCIVFSFVLNNK